MEIRFISHRSLLLHTRHTALCLLPLYPIILGCVTRENYDSAKIVHYPSIHLRRRFSSFMCFPRKPSAIDKVHPVAPGAFRSLRAALLNAANWAALMSSSK